MEATQTATETYIRGGELDHLVETLRTQHARKHDVVVPAQSLRMLDSGG